MIDIYFEKNGTRVTLDQFVCFLNEKFYDYDLKHSPILCKDGPYETVTAEPGKKYIRIVAKKRDQQSGPYLHEGQRHVYCFLDHEGNIYKADSWKKPAKYVRGNVFEFNMGWGRCLDRHGGGLYLR